MVDVDIESVVRSHSQNTKTADITMEILWMLSGMPRCEVNSILKTVYTVSNEYSLFPVVSKENEEE